jgi:choline dehydrogenase-like flavoprotein
VSLQVKHFKILVVGAGAGGCSVANKFASHLGADKVGIIEPASNRMNKNKNNAPNAHVSKMETSRFSVIE